MTIELYERCAVGVDSSATIDSMENDELTTVEAAELLGIARAGVSRLISEGRLTARPERYRGHAYRVLVTRESVERYARERRAYRKRRVSTT